MDEFIPFGVSKTAQDIITEHLNTPKKPSTGAFRNPEYDLRTEQGLPPDALYPNPLLDTTPSTDVPIDPCPPGYELIDGICQPTERFGQSAYQEKSDDNKQEERKYMSIKDMEKASDEELLNYLKDGWLKNSMIGYLPSKGGEVTVGGKFMPSYFQLPFGKQNQMRRDAIEMELRKRGYFTGQYNNNDPVFNINQEPNLFLTPPATTNEAEVMYGGQMVDYGGGEDFGGGNVVVSSNNPNNNVVSYTQNPGNVGTMQSGGGIANPHTQSGFSGGNPFLTQPPQMTAAQQQYMEDYDK